MILKRTLPTLGLIAAAAVLLSGCAADTGAKGDASPGTEEAQSQSITLGFPGSVGPTDAPLLAALNSLGDEGWDVDYIEFDSPDVLTQALMGGDIDVASMGPATVMAADEKGAELTMVGNNNMLDYQLVANASIASCEELDGQTVAYHSEGSTSTAHLRRYLADNCPDAKPEFVVISGSSNRVTALLEGQIDGTIVRLEDWMSVDVDPSVAHVIDDLSETQSELLTQTIVIDGARVDKSGPAVAALLGALDEQFAAVNADPVAFAKIAAEVLGEDITEVQPVLEALVANGTFPESYKLSKASIDATLAFYQAAGTVTDALTADQVANLDIVSNIGE